MSQPFHDSAHARVDGGTKVQFNVGLSAVLDRAVRAHCHAQDVSLAFFTARALLALLRAEGNVATQRLLDEGE